MSYGYGGRPNPFDQRDGGNGGNGGSYGGPPGASFGSGPSPYGRNGGGSGNNMEMSSYPTGGQRGGYSAPAASSDPNAILNECRDIDRGIDSIDRNLDQLRALQQRSLDDADSSQGSMTNRQLDQLSSETMDLYRNLTDKVRRVKSNPESQQPKNAPQVNRIDRRLKQAINNYQQVESQYRKRTQDQMARQYRIVRPDASESEVQAAVEDTSGGQVFSQALMQSSRLGNAQRALSAVQDRHEQIKKIERQMVELAQLFQDVDTMIIQQEAQVQNIEQKAEEVVENLDKGGEEVQTAVTTARATRRKKWWCLLICVLIVVVIVAAVLIYLAVTKQLGGNNNNGGNNGSQNQKRSVLVVDDLGKIILRKTIPSFRSENIARIMAEGMSRT